MVPLSLLVNISSDTLQITRGWVRLILIKFNLFCWSIWKRPECWLPSVCELSDRDGCAVHHPGARFQVYRRRARRARAGPTCPVALTPGCSPNSDCRFTRSPRPDNESRCLLSPLASNQRRCSLPVSPPLILLRAKNSAWKKCTRYKHVMYTNYVNLRRCRWLGVDCGFRIRSGSLKFECGRHVTLITAQPQPSIPLSPVIHLCWLSPADKAAHKS